MSGDGWIRMTDVARSGLAPMHKIALIAMALEELAVAQALAVVHGRERAAEVYVALGGRIRFDDDGEPLVSVAFGQDAQVAP